MTFIAWDEPSRFTDFDAGITVADMYAEVGPDDDDALDADPDDTPVVPVNPYEPDSDGGECDRRAWLTYRQHEAWESLSDLYPHAELVAGPAVRAA